MLFLIHVPFLHCFSILLSYHKTRIHWKGKAVEKLKKKDKMMYVLYIEKNLLPIFKRVGDTNAVSAAYENSIPITAADIFVSSQRFFLLKNNIYVSQINLQNRVNDDENNIVF